MAKKTVKKKPSTIARLKQRRDDFLVRRPHRSFRLTRRRDYVKPLDLPGYISFTLSVVKKLATHKRHFLSLIAIYAGWSFLSTGIVGEEAYQNIVKTVNQTGGDLFAGVVGVVAKPLLLVGALFSSGSQEYTDTQQLLVMGAMLFVWLTTIWLLRAFYQNKTPRLRDALYNAGAPIVPLVALFMVLLLQLLPIGILSIVYSGLASGGFLTEGVSAFMFWVLAGLVMMLALYWAVGTMFAMVIATIPGTYPMAAIRAAGDIVSGIRLRIVYRVLWLVLTVVVAWVAIVIPVVYIDMWLKSIMKFLAGVPIVPITAHVLGAGLTVWAAAYMYVLYREIVEKQS